MLWKLRGPLPVLVAVSAFAGGATPAFAAADARDVARAYLEANAAQFGVSSADLADMTFTSVYETKGLGVTHVNMNQRFRDLEVFGGHVTVNVDSAGKVIFAGGAAVSLAKVASDEQTIDATTAVNKAAHRAQARAADQAARDAPQRHQVAEHDDVRRRHLARADQGRPRLAADRAGPQAGLADADRRHVGLAPVERGGRCQDRRAAQEGGLDLARPGRRAQEPALRVAAQAGQGLRAVRVPDAHAVAGARRLGLPRVRVAEREPERRRSHARGQPGRLEGLAVRLA